MRLLTLLLMTITLMPVYSVVLAAAILTDCLMAFAYALFLVFTLSLSMELLPAGKAGLFNVLVGIGGACGSFIGLFLAQTLGFTYVFLTAGIIFSLAYAFFKSLSALPQRSRFGFNKVNAILLVSITTILVLFLFAGRPK